MTPVSPPPGHLLLRQVLELRQLSLRQDALCQQLEEENAELRDAAEEMRGYVQQLVAENATLAEDLRSGNGRPQVRR